MLQNVSLAHGEVDGGSGEFEILWARRYAFCRRLVLSNRILRQADSIAGVHFLQLVLAREVEDHAAGLAVQGLRSALLDMDIATHDCCAQQGLLSLKKKLSLICAAAHFGRLRLK